MALSIRGRTRAQSEARRPVRRPGPWPRRLGEGGHRPPGPRGRARPAPGREGRRRRRHRGAGRAGGFSLCARMRFPFLVAVGMLGVRSRCEDALWQQYHRARSLDQFTDMVVW